MKQFMVAAQQDVEEQDGVGETEPWATFGLLGQDFTIAKAPKPGQCAAVLGALAGGTAAGTRGVLEFLRNVLDGSGGNVIRQMLERGQIEFNLLIGGDDDNKEGIVDWIISEASAGPPQGPTGSSSSQPTSGKRSTGRSPGKGSTLSD